MEVKHKEIKPYGKVFSQGEEYFLLAPHTEKDVWSDGTFRFLVVPFTDYNFKPFVPRFIITTQFLIEYSVWDEITIIVQEPE